MGKKGGGGSQTTVQQADPWIGVQPHLAELYGNASAWFNGGGGGTAGTNNSIDHSLAMLRDLQGSGTPLFGQGQSALDTAKGMLAPLMNGQWMNNPWTSGQATKDDVFASQDFENPYIDSMVKASSRDVNDQFTQDIAPALMSQFSAAGRTGSGANAMAFGQAASGLAKRLGDISSTIRGTAYENAIGRRFQAYQTERGRQYDAYQQDLGRRMQAAGMMPALAGAYGGLAGQQFGQGLQLADAFNQSGQYQRQIQQEQLDAPFKRLAGYSQLLQGASGYGTQSGSSTSQQPYNRLTGTIGGGLGGYALGSLMGMGPMGAVIGGLGGLFG